MELMQWYRKIFQRFLLFAKWLHIQFLNLTICPCSDTHAHLCSVQKFMYTTVESNISCLALYAKTYFVQNEEKFFEDYAMAHMRLSELG
jgi:hypothetical protein